MKEKFRSASILCLKIVVILMASKRMPADTGTCGSVLTTLPFSDVMGSPFFCQIAEAYFSGLTNGTTPTTYSPADIVSRQQMAAFADTTQSRCKDFMSTRLQCTANTLPNPTAPPRAMDQNKC